VQAASLCFEKNIHIYQHGQPCWRVINFSPAEEHPCMHLSYHNGEHYNSVRRVDDSDTEQPAPISLSLHDADRKPCESQVSDFASPDTICFKLLMGS
jgi:OTU domain-containing protein 3